MSDVFSKAKRSAVMSLIRWRGNKDTELVLAKLLRAKPNQRRAKARQFTIYE